MGVVCETGVPNRPAITMTIVVMLACGSVCETEHGYRCTTGLYVMMPAHGPST